MNGRIERMDARNELALYSECNYHELGRFLEEERRRKQRRIHAYEWAGLIILNALLAIGWAWELWR